MSGEFKTDIGSRVSVKLTRSTEAELLRMRNEVFCSRNLRKAPRPIWAGTVEGRPDSYVKQGTKFNKDAPATDVADDGTVSFGDTMMEQSGVVVDGDGDRKLANGVRVAWYEEHKNGFQHGVIRNIGGNLCLMPWMGQQEPGGQRKTRMERAVAAAEARGDDRMLGILRKRIDDEVADLKRRLAELQAMMYGK